MDSPLRARKQAAECALEHPSSPVAKKFNTQPSAGKLMLTVFWDSKGPILKTYQECGTTVTSAAYWDIL